MSSIANADTETSRESTGVVEQRLRALIAAGGVESHNEAQTL